MASKARLPTDNTDTPRFKALFEELKKESDRSAVLLAAAWIETVLGDILASVLRPPAKADLPDLLDGKGQQPLGSFSARTDILYRLGMIHADFFWALHYLRKLRNDFAHDVDKPGQLAATPHQKNLDGFLRPFHESTAFTAFFSAHVGSPFAEFPVEVKFRQAASYVLSRLLAVLGWSRNKEKLVDVPLFTRNYPRTQESDSLNG